MKLAVVPRFKLEGALVLAVDELARQYYCEETREEILARLLDWSSEVEQILNLRNGPNG